MAEFKVTVEKLYVRNHPNADALELASVGSKDGYQVVIRKGEFETGDLVVYIPEGAVVPAELLEEMGLTGRLAQKDKNVVKAIKLRGQLSQGLILQPKEWDDLDLDGYYSTGQNVAGELGLTKYIPEVPIYMNGKQTPAPDLLNWVEIESVKRYPKVFTEGEPVDVTEKIHGSCGIFQLDVATGQLSVSSKGVAKDGLSLLRQTVTRTSKHDASDLKHANRAVWLHRFFLRKRAQAHLAQIKPLVTTKTEQNLWWRVADAYHILAVLKEVADEFTGATQIALYGEVYGSGIQDLTYGANARGEKPGFAAFDLRIGYQTKDEWVNVRGLQGEVPLVPTLYSGPYSRELVEKLAVGPETVTPDGLHLREGVVIRPQVERYSDVLKGRAIAKVVSDGYLTRKLGDKGVTTEPTEFN